MPCSILISPFLNFEVKGALRLRRPVQRRRRPRCLSPHSEVVPQTTTQTVVQSPLPPELVIDAPQSLRVSNANLIVPDSHQPLSLLDRISKVMPSDRTRGLILLNLMTLIMSTNPVVVKDAQSMMDPVSFTAARFLVATVPFVPLLLKMDVDREVVMAGAELGLWSTLGYLTQGIGLMTTDASRVAFLSALTVILVPIIVGLSGKGVSKLAWCSAAVALIGVGLLSDAGSGHAASVGDAMSLASAAFIAFQVVRTEHYSRVLPSHSRLPLLGISMLTVAVGATALTGCLHPDWIVHGWKHMNDWSMQHCLSWIAQLPRRALLFTGFISTDIVLLIEIMALKDVESTDAAIIYTVEPVLGALWAYAFLGERWGPNGWIGASFILASSFATQVYGTDDNSIEQR